MIRTAKKLHKDQRGEMPIGPILILALIVIPLVIFLISARDDAAESTKAEWDKMTKEGTDITGVGGGA